MFVSYFSVGFILVASITCAVLGLLVVRRSVNRETLVLHHEVAGYLLSVVGTLYAVVLGLIVVGSLNTFEKARLTVATEANTLHNIFHLAQGLPQPTNADVRTCCLAYAKATVNDEWNAMQEGKSSPKAQSLVSELWTTLIKFEPSTQRETDLHGSILSELNTLADSRHLRLTVAEPAYDWIIWTVLIFGGVVLVIFTYFFGVEKLAVQIMMTALVTTILCLNLFVVAFFGYPYSGDVRVTPAPFEEDLARFRQELEPGRLQGTNK